MSPAVRGWSLAFTVACTAVAILTPPAGALGTGQTFEVFHRPPGPIVRGEQVVLQVFVQTSDFGEATGSVYVRSGSSGPFTELPLPSSGRRTVPASFLARSARAAGGTPRRSGPCRAPRPGA